MSNFKKALDKVLKNEGGYVNDPDDAGGETYKGVARNLWPKWEGWQIIDSTPKYNLDFNQDLQSLVADFYRKNFWLDINADIIKNDEVATSIFDFAVNAGAKTAVKLAQKVVDAVEDGELGVKTAEAINAMDPEKFLAGYQLAKIARYVAICKNKPSNRKFFFGWVCRTLELN